MTSTPAQPDQCPACGARNVNTDTGVAGAVCEACGLVHDGNDWASDIADGLDSEGGSKGQAESNGDWREEITIRDATEKQLVTILSKIDEVAEELSLSTEEQNQAADLITEAWKHNLMHGRDMESVIAAGIYVTCRRSGEPRPGTAIAAITGTDETTLQNTYWVLIRELELQSRPPGPTGYIPYLREELGISKATAERARERISGSDACGNPAGIAAAALYSASSAGRESFTLCEAGDAAGVTKETVWRKSKEIGSLCD